MPRNRRNVNEAQIIHREGDFEGLKRILAREVKPAHTGSRVATTRQQPRTRQLAR